MCPNPPKMLEAVEVVLPKAPPPVPVPLPEPNPPYPPPVEEAEEGVVDVPKEPNPLAEGAAPNAPVPVEP